MLILQWWKKNQVLNTWVYTSALETNKQKNSWFAVTTVYYADQFLFRVSCISSHLHVLARALQLDS